VSDVIFIVGYYRSGTSALSGALARLGVALHNDAEPNEHNPLGFYEIPELIEFDLDIFKKLGCEWTDIRPLPERYLARADIAGLLPRLEEVLRRRFAAEPLWGLKHPHLCRLLPIYEAAALRTGARAHAVHILRDPWTVAASQARKNNLSRAHAVLLWVSYVVEAEKLARHLRRSWLTYEELMAEPVQTLRRIAADLELGRLTEDSEKRNAARAFLTDGLNRSVAVKKFDLAQPLRGLVEDVWAAAQDRDFAPAAWDDFSRNCADLVGLLTEIGDSRARVLPGFGASAAQQLVPRAALRPAEREDEGAKRRLLARLAEAGDLPCVAILIAAPPNRAHVISETLETLAAQWHAPGRIEILAADEVHLPGYELHRVGAEAGALTQALCDRLNQLARTHDYVAVLNAGDTIAPDAVLRFALQAQDGQPDMIYCDEIVPAEPAPWVRHKPGWDVTRLRQSAYIGDWVWYRSAKLTQIGGFDRDYAGVEEYEAQLRLAEAGAAVAQLPEALFRRAALSRRDNIPSAQFGQRALDAVAAHLARTGLPGEVFPRAHLGLFGRRSPEPDPGTAIILLCEHADVAALEFWTRTLLSGPELTGPIILAGAGLAAPVASYLAQVTAAPVLRGKVLAVPPDSVATPGDALRAALALAATELVAIVDAGTMPVDEHWDSALRERLADPAVALASARTLVQLAHQGAGFMVQGPIIRGADGRLGAGHLSTDPGPGGWLAVDQEAGAVAPGAILARRATLADCRVPALAGDALWVDLCAQLNEAGRKIVWTPDVSFVARPGCIVLDAGGTDRGLPPTADAHHHPALSLRGDVLAAERRFGLVAPAPADPHDLLLSGNPESGLAVLNATRALRMAGRLEAGWSPEPLSGAEILRRAAAAWVRLNPDLPQDQPYTAIYTRAPEPSARDAIAAAKRVYATSPAVASALRALAPDRLVVLWRPALSVPVWQDFTPAGGLNTKPRLLWVDEGIAPSWLPDFINQTANIAAWIVVEKQDRAYAGPVAWLRPPEDEQGWARELAALAPHMLLRPAGERADADHYVTLLAAAAGCRLLVDDRLDVPASLGAMRLPNDNVAWNAALRSALDNFAATLEVGAASRAACLALPSVEAAPPGWIGKPATRQGVNARRAAAE
jgi:hypothetical protein